MSSTDLLQHSGIIEYYDLVLFRSVMTPKFIYDCRDSFLFHIGIIHECASMT